MALTNAIIAATRAQDQANEDEDSGRMREIGAAREARGEGNANGFGSGGGFGSSAGFGTILHPRTASEAATTGPSQWTLLQERIIAAQGSFPDPAPDDVAQLMRSIFMQHLMSGAPEYSKYFKNDIRMMHQETELQKHAAKEAEASASGHRRAAAAQGGSAGGASDAAGVPNSPSAAHSQPENHEAAPNIFVSAYRTCKYVLARYRASPLRAKIYLTLSHPEYNTFAFVFGMFIMLVILLNTTVFCIESVPRWENTPLYDRLVIVDYVCLGIFTAEFLARLLTCSSLRHFWLNAMNWVDFFAIAPFYLELMIVGPDAGNQAASQTRIIRVLRLLRVLRLMRASTRFRNLQVVVDALVASGDVLGMLVFLLLVLLVVSATIIYFVEQALVEGSWFDSIPLTIYYMHVTLTTTGYGDLYPVSAWGRFIAGVFMLLCMVTLSLPISVIGGNFSNMWGRYTHIRDGIERSGQAWTNFLTLRTTANKHCNAMDNLIDTINRVKCVLEDGTRAGGGLGGPGADGLKALVDDLGGLQLEMETVNLRRGSATGAAGGGGGGGNSGAQGPGGGKGAGAGGQHGQQQGPAADEARIAQLRLVAESLTKRVEWARAQYSELQALLHVSGRLSSKDVTEKLDKLHGLHKEMAGWALDGGFIAGHAGLLLADLRALRKVVQEHTRAHLDQFEEDDARPHDTPVAADGSNRKSMFSWGAAKGERGDGDGDGPMQLDPESEEEEEARAAGKSGPKAIKV
ncbi:hypothetical protein HYH02_005923 [Chlamydomonas schloesseri]|uniref:Ion transport domain-containing protein n=1 Tax=Chlamydomonas schloesseri TaxID=2026947 RepID=A0A835WLE7_9CHLO|nr:hypothetical protein HYH02_005923 [Chlamydomonas schloesseri]|eukprot:KAG2449176.1 hypothetical protein HYH02_005923 [Chlamydomonas schloesseri]